MSDGLKNGYVSVEEVLKQKYIIPTYQRGYRWGEDNVKKLLEDIYEDKLLSIDPNADLSAIHTILMLKKSKLFIVDEVSGASKATNPYCIQPLVICEVDNTDDPTGDGKKYYVIDGQQRLTTIAIILKAMESISTAGGGDRNPEDALKTAFNIEYQSRPESAGFLNGLGSGTVEEKKNENIDFMYMAMAFECAKGYFEIVINKYLKIKDFYVDYLKQILLKNTRFIWYCIDASEMDPHEVFANFNTGKLELTNAELIKALFMDKSNYDTDNIDDKRIVISEKWDEIENALHNPDFWAFVPHADQYGRGEYETRIDVIFEMFLMTKKMNEEDKPVDLYIQERMANSSDRYVFDEIDKWIKKELAEDESNGSKNRNEVMQSCWYEIRKVYLGLLELYEVDTISGNSNRIYNMTGLLINLMNRKTGCSDTYNMDPFNYLKVYHCLHEVMDKPRSERIDKLKELIRAEIGIKQDQIKTWIRKIRYSGSNESDSNVDKKPENIVKLLIIYNIALLNNSEGIGQRFNFRDFAEKKWEREHIFASNLDEKKNVSCGLDSEEERRTALEILSRDIVLNNKNKYENPYVEYVKEVYFSGPDFPPIVASGNGVEKPLDFADEPQVKIFRDKYISRTDITPNLMLARAIDVRNKSIDMLSYYEIIDRIDRAKNAPDKDKEIIEETYYDILRELGNRFYYRDYVDIDDDLQKQLADYPSQEKYTIKIGEYQIEINSGEEKDDIIERIKTRYGQYIRDLYMKNETGSDRADDYELKKKEEIDPDTWKKLFSVFDIYRRTLIRKIDEFFNKEFAKLLEDNSMGNMTLLTGGAQNQIVSNKSYKLKKEHIRKFMKEGQFVPLGTLMVFSDTYNDSAYTSNFWLPDSRKRYLDDLIDTVRKFLE